MVGAGTTVAHPFRGEASSQQGSVFPSKRLALLQKSLRPEGLSYKALKLRAEQKSTMRCSAQKRSGPD
jgi:hypothetical protein